MKTLFALAAIFIAAGCRKADTFDRRGDTSVTPPVSAAPTPAAPASPAADSSKTVAKTCGVNGTPLLTDDGIGDLKVGRRVADIRSLCEVVSDAKEQRSEGMMERVLVVRLGGDVVSSIVNNDKISRIEVNSPHFQTRDSLGVDTPLSRIARKRGAKFYPGEDGVYGFVADHCALSFRFSVPLRPPKGRDWTAAAIDSAHGDATVDRVLVTQCRQ